MKLIKLTDQLNNQVLLRADLLVSTTPSGSDTKIILSNGSSVTVRESIDEIIELCNDTSNSN